MSKPHGLPVTNCKSCQRPIFFAESKSGKQIPLVNAPHAQGNVMIRDGKAVYKSKENQPEPGELLYISHFVDCPNAQQYRTKKAPG